MRLRAVVIGAGEGHTIALRAAGVDGWLANEVIDIVRSHEGRTFLPEHPAGH